MKKNEEKFGCKNKKFKLHFLAEKVKYTENPKSEGGPPSGFSWYIKQ